MRRSRFLAVFWQFSILETFVFPIPTPFLIFGSTFMMYCNLYKNRIHFFRQNQGKNGKFQQFSLFILPQISAIELYILHKIVTKL